MVLKEKSMESDKMIAKDMKGQISFGNDVIPGTGVKTQMRLSRLQSMAN